MVACRPMRALVPLVTAAALAITGWLASGIVTVRSIEQPARIGILPAPSTLVLLSIPLLALAAASVIAGQRPRGLTLAAVGLPVVLPWLPVPWPVAVLVWTGPLAVAWWCVTVVFAYRDAWRGVRGTPPTERASAERGTPPTDRASAERGTAPTDRASAERGTPSTDRGSAELGGERRDTSVLQERFTRLFLLPSQAPVVAAVLTGVTLVAAAWHTAPQHPKGDEPDYLIITQSVLLDRDLQIENNHTRADYAVYHSNVLPPSYLQRGTNGAIYSVHAPGLPIALVPGFVAAGYRGAVLTLVMVAMAGAWLAWRAGWDVTRDARAAWFGTLATVGAAPFFLHGAAIFPDAPASVLALLVVSALLRDAPMSPAVQAIALGLLPWLHTRYAILSVGLGAMVLARLVATSAWRRVVIFLAPAVLLALAWFGFFYAIYGTPSPSAPYGAYTQMALAHLKPGLPGLLFDQQFGLFASAPVLVLALVALRPEARVERRSIWRSAWLVASLFLAYTCVVAAYRMWWGGLSAPARFLVPLVLPLAPFIAFGWVSLRTRASRQLAIALLVASLAFTAMLVVVDHGVLAYNVRDGRARWAVWVSPVVDLVAALPAAHRDAPGIVVRDASVWIGGLALAWALWRTLERRNRLTTAVPFATIAVLVPALSATVWAARGVSGLAPAESQVRFLERNASASAHMLWSITRPPVGRTRNWFEVEIASRRSGAAADFSLLRLDRLPAGRYRLFSTATAPDSRLGVTLGESRAERFLAELTPASQASSAFTLAVPVTGVVVKGSREATASEARTWIQADETWDVPVAPATRSHPVGDVVWLIPEEGIYPEPGGAWLAGDADVVVGVISSGPLAVHLRAGAAEVVVSWEGTGAGSVHLAPGTTRAVTMTPAAGRLRLHTRGGFRPSHTTGSADHRLLGVWIAAP